jgi:hypothetical protein
MRLYTWVENYNEEWIARDWLLKSIDENFNSQGISISYPTEVEIGTTAKVKDDSEKANRQKLAREQMAIEEQRFQDEKEMARQRVKELEEEIKTPVQSGEKVYDLEFS